MGGNNENLLLKQASAYYRQGWCIIPIPHGKKEARIRWKRYQTERPTDAQVRKWFAANNSNIAVVLGSVSGRLTCRDFDDERAHSVWKNQHPNLAAKLPTVRTARGYHVYFLADVSGIQHFDDGELRGKGGYCLLPPSIHPDGVIYEWLIEPNSENLLLLDTANAGFIPSTCDATEKTEKTEENRRHKGGRRKKSKICVGDFEKIITDTLPERFGMRNRRVFDLARVLRSLPEWSDSGPKYFKPVVREWRKRALPNIRTKEFEETWIDFLKAWSKIRWKVGESPMSETFEKAKTMSIPDCAAEYDIPKLRLLVAWCKILQQQAGNGCFFLSARKAGRYLGVHERTANRWLFLLEQDRIVEVVEKGRFTRNGGIATRFRYVADNEQQKNFQNLDN